VNVLFLTHRLPYAPNRGDRIRAYHVLQHLSTFADVSLFSLVHDDEEAAKAGSMPFARHVSTARVTPLRNRVRALASLGTMRPLTHLLLDAPDAAHALASSLHARPPDVVLAYCSSMAKWALRAPLHRRPLVLDMVDVDSGKWGELATRSRWPRQWIYRREAVTLSAFEAEAARHASTTLVVNEREADLMRRLAPDVDVRVIPNGIDVAGFARPQHLPDDRIETAVPRAGGTVVFCGVMSYEPNVAGVLWFAERVWPAVRRTRPDAQFTIVGADPVPRIRDLSRSDPSIIVTGPVDRVQPYLWRADVSIAPLQVARGLQNKVVEALAAGLPVVATRTVIEGLPAETLAGCREANTESEFAQQLVDLLATTPDDRRTLAARARLDGLNWSERLGSLQGILTAASQRR
jgi:sugar transferase (PEP-CTERM/EpsH1 system associated)